MHVLIHCNEFSAKQQKKKQKQGVKFFVKINHKVGMGL